MSGRALFWLLVPLLLISGCRRQQAFDTPIEALTQFPGYLNGGIPPSFRLLTRRSLPQGDVLLYAFGGTRPDVEGITCVATTFVSEEGDGRWRAQSSGSLGCHSGFPQPEEIVLGYTLGGNIAGLATVYGMAPGGKRARVQWADGQVQVSEIEEGYVLVSRQETIQPSLIEVQDAAGNVLLEERIEQ